MNLQAEHGMKKRQTPQGYMYNTSRLVFKNSVFQINQGLAKWRHGMGDSTEINISWNWYTYTNENVYKYSEFCIAL